jgi:ribosomal protein S18 acetylase RimI-like enzyme
MPPVARPTWRHATSLDDEALVALSAQLYIEDPSSEAVPIENMRRTLETFRAQPVRGRALALVRESGAVVGYALLVSFWSNELGGELVEVDELYVAQEARNLGLASELLTELHDGTRLWAPRPVALLLQVTKTNERAKALYSRLGFRDRKNATMVWR